MKQERDVLQERKESIFNYLNLFSIIWIYFYPLLFIGLNIFLFIIPLVLSILGKQMKNIRPTEIISTNIRPMLVKHQIDIIQASDNYQTNFSILQSFKSKLEISCILDKLHVFPRNVEQYLTILSLSACVLNIYIISQYFRISDTVIYKYPNTSS